MVEYLGDHLESGDTVLVWGNDPSVNVFTDAPSPTKFYFRCLTFTGDHRQENASRMLADLEESPPAFVIDTHAWMPAPLFPALNAILAWCHRPMQVARHGRSFG